MAIHSIAKTNAGEALNEYVRSFVEPEKLKLIYVHDPSDVAAIAHSQAAIKLADGLLWLLNAELADLLKQYNIEPEGDEHD